MTVVLAYIVRNESFFLSHLVPVMRPAVDAIVVVDTGSEDGTVELLKRWGARVMSVPWCEDYSTPRNIAMSMAFATGATWCLMPDADECIEPSAIRRSLCFPRAQCVAFRSVHIALDYGHYHPTINDDWHVKLFRRSGGFRFHGNVHEALWSVRQNRAAMHTEGCRFNNADPLWHYGLCKSPEFVTLKNLNYRRIADGQPSLQVLPPGMPLEVSYVEPFAHSHPLAFLAPKA